MSNRLSTPLLGGGVALLILVAVLSWASWYRLDGRYRAVVAEIERTRADRERLRAENARAERDRAAIRAEWAKLVRAVESADAAGRLERAEILSELRRAGPRPAGDEEVEP